MYAQTKQPWLFKLTGYSKQGLIQVRKNFKILT